MKLMDKGERYGLDPTKDNVVFRLGPLADDGIARTTEPIPSGIQYITTNPPKEDHPTALYVESITSLLLLRGDDGKLEVTVYCKKA